MLYFGNSLLLQQLAVDDCSHNVGRCPKPSSGHCRKSNNNFKNAARQGLKFFIPLIKGKK